MSGGEGESGGGLVAAQAFSLVEPEGVEDDRKFLQHRDGLSAAPQRQGRLSDLQLKREQRAAEISLSPASLLQTGTQEVGEVATHADAPSLIVNQVSRAPTQVKSPSRRCVRYKPSMDYARLGAKLRALREDKKITQAEIAEVLGMSDSNISLIEKGRVRTPLDNLEAYAEAVGGRIEVVVVDQAGSNLMDRLSKVVPNLSPKLRRTLSAWLDIWEGEADEADE